MRLASAAARLRSEIGGSASMAIVCWREPLDRARELLAPDAFEAAAAWGER